MSTKKLFIYGEFVVFLKSSVSCLSCHSFWLLLWQTADVAEVDPTKRLAVCNLDWDNIRAVDLFVVFRSFIPPDGEIIRVSIHPSEYGKEQMEIEEQRGPNRDIWANGEVTIDDENDDDLIVDEATKEEERKIKQLSELHKTLVAMNQGSAGDVIESEKTSTFNKEKLRAYELQRLKYYYAVCVIFVFVEVS